MQKPGNSKITISKKKRIWRFWFDFENINYAYVV